MLVVNYSTGVRRGFEIREVSFSGCELFGRSGISVVDDYEEKCKFPPRKGVQ